MATSANPFNMQALINPLDPSSSANAYQIQRQLQMAQALQQQALQPMDADLPKNMPIMPRVGIGNGLLKIAQALVARDAMDSADKNAGELATRNMTALSAALDPNGPTKAMPADQAAQASLQMGAANGSVGPTVANAATMDKLTTPQPGATGSPLNPVGMNKQLAAYMLMNKPEKYWEIQGKAYEPTEMQRNNNYLGISRDQARDLELASRTKAGLMEAQPGNTIIDPITRKPVYTAPDFKTGIQGSFDAAGNPRMSLIQGADVIPYMAGATKRAEAGGTAAYNMVTVNTPNGPVMMTAEQAANLSGGGGTQAPVVFTASNGVKLNLAGMTPQQIFDTAQASKDPEFIKAVNEWAASGRKAPGIALQDEGTQAANTQAGKQGVDTIFTQYGTLRTAPDMINTLESAKALVPKSFAGSGAETKLEIAKFFNGTFGTNIAAEKVKNTEELRSILFRQVMDNLKKMDSQPSESQQRMLQSAMGTIGTDPAAIPNVIKITQDILAQRVAEHNNTVEQAKQQGVQFPFMPTIKLPAYGGAPAAPTPTAPAPAAPPGWSIRQVP